MQAAAEAEIDKAQEASLVTNGADIAVASGRGKVKGAFSTYSLAPFAVGLFLGTIIGMGGSFLVERKKK